jgi:hypothetical protein
MGKTSFTGPVFGAKQSLIDCGPVSASTGSSAAFYGVIVPAGEDWFVTDLAIFRNSTGSTDLAISVLDDSTNVLSVTANGSSIAFSNIGRATADSGEFQGTKIASGSTITLVHSSHAGPNANLCVQVSGFRRYLPSTTYRE